MRKHGLSYAFFFVSLVCDAKDLQRQGRSSVPVLIHERRHRLRGSGSTVVTMTSKVNGRMEILDPL